MSKTRTHHVASAHATMRVRRALAACIALAGMSAATVRAGGDEPNDSTEEATPTGIVGVGTYTTTGAFIGDGAAPDRDVDLYRFEIDAPSVPVIVTLDVAALDPTLDAYVRLLDRSFMELANNDDRSFGNNGPHLRTYILEPSEYFVGVSSAADQLYGEFATLDRRPGSTGAYVLTITTEAATIPSSPFEPNDDADRATAMGGESFTVVGEFVGDGEHGRLDVDIYRLDLTGAARLDVEVKAEAAGSTLDPVVRLRSCDAPLTEPTYADFCALGANDDAHAGTTDSFLPINVPRAGPVYVMVSGAGNRTYNPALAGSGEIGSVGGYELVVTVTYAQPNGPDEPNDSVLTATSVPIFVTGRPDLFESGGVIGDGPYALTHGDRDFYAVRMVEASRFLTVDVSPAPGSELDPVVAIYDAGGRRLAVDDNSGGGRAAHVVLSAGCVPLGSSQVSAYVLVMGTQQRFPTDPFVPWPNENRLEEFAAGDGPGSTGTYELTIRAELPNVDCADDPGDTLATATPTGLVDEGSYFCGDGVLGDGPCTQGEPDIDMLSLNVVHAPAVLTIRVWNCGAQALDCYGIRLFSETGTELAAWSGEEYYAAPGAPLADHTFTFNSPGTYFVGLSEDPYGTYDPQVPCSGESSYCDGEYEISIELMQGNALPGAPGGIAGESAGDPADTSLLVTTHSGGLSGAIQVLNTETGENVADFAAPERVSGAEGIGFDGTDLYYIGTGRYPTLYHLDPWTGDVLDDYILWMGTGFYSDAVMLAGELFVLDLVGQSIHAFDPVERRAGRVLQVGRFNPIVTSGAMAALAGPPRLYLAGPVRAGVIHEVEPATGRVTSSFPTEVDHPTALAGSGDSELFVANWQSNEVSIIDRTGVGLDALTLAQPPFSLGARAAISTSADFDHDADVDLVDVAFFLRCYSGPNGVVALGCEAADFNADSRVDMADYAALAPEATGP